MVCYRSKQGADVPFSTRGWTLGELAVAAGARVGHAFLSWRVAGASMAWHPSAVATVSCVRVSAADRTLLGRAIALECVRGRLT